MGKATKILNGVKFSVVGHRTTKRKARTLATSIRKNHLARVLKGKDARGNPIWLVWASIKKKRRKK